MAELSKAEIFDIKMNLKDFITDCEWIFEELFLKKDSVYCCIKEQHKEAMEVLYSEAEVRGFQETRDILFYLSECRSDEVFSQIVKKYQFPKLDALLVELDNGKYCTLPDDIQKLKNYIINTDNFRLGQEIGGYKIDTYFLEYYIGRFASIIRSRAFTDETITKISKIITNIDVWVKTDYYQIPENKIDKYYIKYGKLYDIETQQEVIINTEPQKNNEDKELTFKDKLKPVYRKQLSNIEVKEIEQAFNEAIENGIIKQDGNFYEIADVNNRQIKHKAFVFMIYLCEKYNLKSKNDPQKNNIKLLNNLFPKHSQNDEDFIKRGINNIKESKEFESLKIKIKSLLEK